MRLRPTCTSAPSSPDSPPKPKALDESDLRIDGVRRDAPARQRTGTPPAADSRTDCDRVPRKSAVCQRHERLRGEGPDRGAASQDAPAAKKVSTRPASRLACTLGTVPAR